jgi:8-oxo-dGTP diphosphatase
MKNNSKSRIRVAGVVTRDDKLLLLKGKGYEYYWTPGGKVDGEESNEECLKRELKEEIGVNLISVKLFKEYEGVSFFNSEIKQKQIVYLIEIDGSIKPDAEIESYIWMSKEDYENKKYNTRTDDNLILDLIKENIW